MILTHGANSFARGGDTTSVEIGGKTYPVVRIGSQLWIAENLRYQPDGITMTETWDDDVTAYARELTNYDERYGYYYNGPCIDIINASLPAGWRIPTKSDFESLIGTTQADYGTNTASILSLRAVSGWTSPASNGTDGYGFALLPSGYINAHGWIVSVSGREAKLASSTPSSVSPSIYYGYLNQYVGGEMQVVVNNGPTGYHATPIRLVKDA